MKAIQLLEIVEDTKDMLKPKKRLIEPPDFRVIE